jgi:hypothetical protein
LIPFDLLAAVQDSGLFGIFMLMQQRKVLDWFQIIWRFYGESSENKRTDTIVAAAAGSHLCPGCRCLPCVRDPTYFSLACSAI